jgi:hypothetical protein
MLLSFEIMVSLDVTPCSLVISKDIALKLASFLHSTAMYQLQSRVFKVLPLSVSYLQICQICSPWLRVAVRKLFVVT